MRDADHKGDKQMTDQVVIHSVQEPAALKGPHLQLRGEGVVTQTLHAYGDVVIRITPHVQAVTDEPAA